MARKGELQSAISAARRAFLGVGLMSGAINVLYLTGSFYMLEIYDRVVPSRSVPTLVGISIIALVLYAVQGVLDVIRGRVLSRIGASLDARLGGRIFDLVSRLPLLNVEGAANAQPLRDLDQIRGFVSSSGPAAFFDLPWIPIYVLICFGFHPWLGVTVLAGLLLLIAIALLTEARSRQPAQVAARAAFARQTELDAVHANAEVVRAMGMGPALLRRWLGANASHREAHQRAADVVSNLGGLAKILRMILQSAVLALGAYLVINQLATGGIIIASSILSSRAFAPVEMAIANWKGFVAARQSWQRLSKLLEKLPEEGAVTRLPAPKSGLSVANALLRYPGQERFVLQDVSLQLTAGQGVGVIGPSASGKSTLARVITGVLKPERGRVALDGAALDQWSIADLGRYIGYLPQDVELFSGTIAENISRFAEQPDAEAVLAAATAAGVHDMVVALPKGYETPVGPGGAALSAGQRQRVGLARALYGDPFLVVLDEPNSNLDADGEAALTRAIAGVRKRGGIAVVVAHRPSAIAACDVVLVLNGGRVVRFGAKDEVLQAALRPVPGRGQAQAAAVDAPARTPDPAKSVTP